MRLGSLIPPLAVVIAALVCAACAPSANDPVAEVEDPGAILVDSVALEQFFTAQLEEHHIPGLAVAIVDKTGVVFSAGYGWADLDGGVPMTPETVMNIASISKTVTNLAVLQLRDQGLLDLDDDVSMHLPFAVRHPAFLETKITVRQLLTHTSGIQDGEAYGASYACGDPAVPLETWIRGYFEVGGSYYDDKNFLETAPGKAYSYSNVGYGLLGYLVEAVSGVPFADYIQSNIFEPLRMTESGWYLSDIDPRQHATPYAWMEAGSTLENDLFVETGDRLLEEDEFVPFCLYSFFNIPDGLVRTSVRQLANYLVSHIRGGEFEGRQILAGSTVEEILSPQLDDSMIEDGDHVQGLAWGKRSLDVGEVWGHGGADPGVRTYMGFSSDEGRGVILFANGSSDISGVVERLIDEALK